MIFDLCFDRHPSGRISGDSEITSLTMEPAAA